MAILSKLAARLVSGIALRALAWSVVTAQLLVLATACATGGEDAGGELPDRWGGAGLGEQVSALSSDSLSTYADKCDLAIGATVPWFNCGDAVATEVPVTGYGVAIVPADGNAACDRPEQLHEQCDAQSRFRVLVDTTSVSIVAHCRKRFVSGEKLYGDIAVIQHNKHTGATCFYQAIGGDLDGSNVRPPSEGNRRGAGRHPSILRLSGVSAVMTTDSSFARRT